jgi:hydroxypyruvate isomerase
MPRHGIWMHRFIEKKISRPELALCFPRNARMGSVLTEAGTNKRRGVAMKFSVCTDAIFSDMKTADAMKIVKDCGFSAVEFWNWWDKDLDAIAAAHRELGVEVAAFCTRFISLTDPSKREAFVQGLKDTLEAAKKLECKTLIAQVGDDTGARRDFQHQSIIDGLKACAPLLEEAGVTLTIEPLNTRVNHIGYYLWSSEEGADIIDAVGSPNVKMLFDYYHQQIMEGDLVRRSIAVLGRIGHIHTAGTPGRHELTDGEVNYPCIFRALEEAGYNGYVGLEYFPLEDAQAGLKALAQYA